MENLIGKTIKSIEQKSAVGYDDNGFLLVEFTDGSQHIIVASYGGYSGESMDECPTDIYVTTPDELYKRTEITLE